MANSAENLERVRNAIVLNSVKHSYLGLTSAIYREREARTNLAESLANANNSLSGLIKEVVQIGTTEWFQSPGLNPGNYSRRVSGLDRDFKIFGEFQGIDVLDESLVENLEPDHKPDPARICLVLRRLGEFDGETFIPQEAMTGGIVVVTTVPVLTPGTV